MEWNASYCVRLRRTPSWEAVPSVVLLTDSFPAFVSFRGYLAVTLSVTYQDYCVRDCDRQQYMDSLRMKVAILYVPLNIVF
jgi:hypothetical protein